MKKYIIINKKISSEIKENFIVGETDSLEKAKELVKNYEKTDKEMQKYYGWKSVPSYEIIEK